MIKRETVSEHKYAIPVQHSNLFFADFMPNGYRKEIHLMSSSYSHFVYLF